MATMIMIIMIMICLEEDRTILHAIKPEDRKKYKRK
jgi:hypothetical protein